jgi:prepilin-type processing-associated H-X9-DG protein
VIALIALLIAFLLPALGGARRAALSLKCVNNLRQISAGGAMHAQRHKGFYPLAGNLQVPGPRPQQLEDSARVRYTYYEPPANGSLLASFHGAIGAMFGHPGGLDEFTFENQVAAENDPEGFLRMFYCPSDLDRPQEMQYAIVFSVPNFYWYLRQSYVVNEAFLGWDDSLGRRRGNIHRIARPSEVFLAMDGRPGDPSRPDSAYPFATVINKTAVGPVTLADALAGNARGGDPQNFDHRRHRRRINLCFLDGHAESIALEPARLSGVLVLP